MMARMLIPILILLAIEYYAMQSFTSWAKTLTMPLKQIMYVIYGILTLGVFAFLFAFPILRTSTAYPNLRTVCTVLVMAVVVAKLGMSIILSLDDLRRLLTYFIQSISNKVSPTGAVANAISRSAFMQKTSLLVGGTLFGTLVYGMRNRYNYKLHTVAVPIPNLPEALKKLRIVQISDVHSGSFTNPDLVMKGVEAIMNLQPDLIFFTGDLVNNKASEMLPYIDIFAKLKATYGVYSTLGNHDYGDYVQWPSAREKLENLNSLKAIHQQMEWQLLLNQNKMIDVNGCALAIIGVENISGSNKFHSYGNFNQACKGTEAVAHKILLSHDPSHWDAEVKSSEHHIMLTLSGHTHGMQFGIDIPGFKWSPIQYVYKKWAGLYSENNRNLYVNRGFGFLGYSGRVGILPEITAIKLV